MWEMSKMINIETKARIINRQNSKNIKIKDRENRIKDCIKLSRNKGNNKKIISI